MTESIFYVNGDFVPADRATLPVTDLAIVRGYGVFDALRTYATVPFHLDDHLARLERSASAIGIKLPWSRAELASLTQATLDRNGLPNATIRIIVSGGSAPDLMTPSGKPSLIIMVGPVPERDEMLYLRGGAMTTTRMVRERPAVKSLNYIGAIMAMEEARKNGCLEALYCTEDGYVTEATRSNFFIFKDEQLIAPNSDILDGITRRVLLTLAAKRIEIVERPVHVDELSTADEAFITSSIKEVVPIVQIDDIVIGDGRPGERTRELIELFTAYTQTLSIQQEVYP